MHSTAMLRHSPAGVSRRCAARTVSALDAAYMLLRFACEQTPFHGLRAASKRVSGPITGQVILE
jgi:hypothetical protein